MVRAGRRVRRRLVFGGLMVVLALVAAAGVYATATDPLEYGGGGVVAAGEQAEHPDAMARFRYDFRFVPLGPIRWGIDVRNAMLVPVTIRGLHADADLQSTLVTDPTLHLVAGNVMQVEALRPFAPVALEPGEAAFLAMTEHFIGCARAQERWIAGSALVRQDLWFEVSVVGLPRLARVPLPFDLAYDAPDGEGC